MNLTLFLLKVLLPALLGPPGAVAIDRAGGAISKNLEAGGRPPAERPMAAKQREAAQFRQEMNLAKK